jgi:hypothetical protein
MSKIEGGCRCGAIRYESESEPTKLVATNCRHGHRHPKATVAVSVGIPERTLRVRGLIPSVYEDARPSGSVVLRSFCPECSTPLFTETDSEPTMIFIKATTLNRNVWMQPQVFYNSARYRQEIQPAKQERRLPRLLEWLKREVRSRLGNSSVTGPRSTDRLNPVTQL